MKKICLLLVVLMICVVGELQKNNDFSARTSHLLWAAPQTNLKFLEDTNSQSTSAPEADAAPSAGLSLPQESATDLRLSGEEPPAIEVSQGVPAALKNFSAASGSPKADEKTPDAAAATPDSETISAASPGTEISGSSASDSSSNAASDHLQRTPYDPIQENGEYFVGWESPKLALVLTGLLSGYIEPCGCAGMDRMKGGLSRRMTFLEDLQKRNWPVLAIDSGQTSNGFGVQEELKYDMATNALRLMDYKAVGIGKNELRFPAYFLLTFTAQSQMSEPSPFVSANVGLYGFNASYVLPYKVLEQNGCKIGYTSVVFPDENLSHRDENILVASPAKKLLEVMPKLREEKCDCLVLTVHGSELEAQNLAKQFLDFDVIITSDGSSAPPAEPIILNGKQYLIELGEKGKYAIVLGFYDNVEQPIRYQRVALDSRYESSREIQILMKEYQDILKSLIETGDFRKGLGLNSVESPQKAMLGEYVGSSKCESCHEESYRIWRRNRHSTAWNSLTETAIPARNFDPECISCHVVGWNGIENFPYIGGFLSEEKTPELKNVGCESCHGPGSKHIEAELGDDEMLQENLRTALRLGNSTKQVCFSCHDGDNSPDFDFDTYYPIIEHKESLDDEEE